MTINDNVYPLCLPNNYESDPNSMEGDFVTLVGYGPATDDSTLVNKVHQRILPQQRCSAQAAPAGLAGEDGGKEGGGGRNQPD